MEHDVAMLEHVLENLHDSVYFLDLDRRIVFWNKAAERVTGYPREAVIGSRCSDGILIHLDHDGRHLCAQRCPAAATMEDGELRESLVYFHHRDGHRVPVRTRVLPLRNAEGRVVGAYEVFHEVTSEADREARIADLERLAMHDALTHLPNRRYLESRLRARFEDFRREGWPMGVLMADLDEFKAVNDGYGHDAGDRVLRAVASTLANGIRGGDVIGRWGGEEFLAVVGDVDEPGLAQVANRLCSLVRFTPVAGPSAPIAVTITIGGALAQPGDDLAGLVARADRAMYEGKSTGRDRFVLAR
jgi:diguanylate cyclase (GGDEF)-like protein/PAS domain S-box-containing protein